jgi:hypothetical protein
MGWAPVVLSTASCTSLAPGFPGVTTAPLDEDVELLDEEPVLLPLLDEEVLPEELVPPPPVPVPDEVLPEELVPPPPVPVLDEVLPVELLPVVDEVAPPAPPVPWVDDFAPPQPVERATLPRTKRAG